MYHSITIQRDNRSYNTWEHLHLIPTSRPVPQPPEARTKMVQIPGRKGSLDLSDGTFGMRSGTWEWIVVNEYDAGILMDWNYLKDHFTWQQLLSKTWDDLKNGKVWVERTWIEAYVEFWNIFNGKVCRIILEDDPTYFYEGRITFPQWQTGANWSTITISYTLKPYKKLITNEGVKSL